MMKKISSALINKISMYMLVLLLGGAMLACSGCGVVVNKVADEVSARITEDDSKTTSAQKVIDTVDSSILESVGSDINASIALNESKSDSNISTNVDVNLENSSVALDNTTTMDETSISSAYYEENTSVLEGVDTEAEILAVTASPPAISVVLTPQASGTNVLSNSKAAIDASNCQDGYIMIKYTAGASNKIKILVDYPNGIRYTYNLNSSGTYEVFPLSGGNGTYKVGIYENVYGTKYATAYSTSISVTLSDQFAPFLRPNQYVNFSSSSQTVAKAAELCRGENDELTKVSAIYNYVVNNFTYDSTLAASVQSGYLPNLDSVLASKKGICFDYASLMTAMLRSQGIPTKLVVGYSGSAYHAWINTYLEGQGWVNGVIHFDGQQWKLMDPTYASSNKSSAAIMQYIGNGANYSAKYLY